MKFLWVILTATVLWFAAAVPALAQNPATVKLCIPTSPTACAAVTATNPLPITGSFSATLAGFTPNGNYTTLTATAATSASTALPAGTVVAFQNLSLIDVSCVLTAGASTATTNKLIVRGGATVFYTVGANTTAACINQTGVASNVIGLAGGAGLGTNFGGGGGGGGGGGAVTLASGAVASGAYASGSIASGAIASGALASGSIAAGAQVDLLTMRGTVAAGTVASNSMLTGCIYNSSPITMTTGQGAAVQCSINGYANVVVTNTLASVTPGDGITTTIYGTAPASPIIGVPLLWNGTTYDRQKSVATGIAAVGGSGSAGTAAVNVVTVQGIASMTPILNNPGTPANWGVGATASAVPANAIYNGVLDAVGGANLLGLAGDPCQTSVKSTLPITLATAAVKVIATGVSAKKIYVCQINLNNNAADTVAIFEATTATTCATSAIAVVGAGTSVASAGTGYNFAATGGISIGNGANQVLQTATNANDLCIAQSAATQLTGSITYVTR